MFLCFKDLSHKIPMFFQRNYTLVKGNWGNCYEWNYTPGWNILLNASNIVKPPLLLTHSYRLNAEYTIKLLQWDKDLKLIDRYFFNFLWILCRPIFVNVIIRPADHVVRPSHIKHLETCLTSHSLILLAQHFQ